jgi:hypothetical protein
MSLKICRKENVSVQARLALFIYFLLANNSFLTNANFFLQTNNTIFNLILNGFCIFLYFVVLHIILFIFYIHSPLYTLQTLLNLWQSIIVFLSSFGYTAEKIVSRRSTARECCLLLKLLLLSKQLKNS